MPRICLPAVAALFVSYSRADRASVSNIAGGLQQAGHDVWWDRHLRPHQDFGVEIEAALRRSNCAIVAWSATARDSLWVRAEATAAWETRKLVQLSLDGVTPPLPFTMIHLLDFSKGAGVIGGPLWCALEEAVQSVARGEPPRAAEPVLRAAPLAGFGNAAAVGGASLALIITAAGIVGVGVTGLFSSSVFGLCTVGMFLAALLAFAHMVTRVISVALASR